MPVGMALDILQHADMSGFVDAAGAVGCRFLGLLAADHHRCILAADHHRCILAADHHRCLVLLQDVDVVSEVFELGAQRRCGCPD